MGARAPGRCHDGNGQGYDSLMAGSLESAGALQTFPGPSTGPRKCLKCACRFQATCHQRVIALTISIMTSPWCSCTHARASSTLPWSPSPTAVQLRGLYRCSIPVLAK